MSIEITGRILTLHGNLTGYRIRDGTSFSFGEIKKDIESGKGFYVRDGDNIIPVFIEDIEATGKENPRTRMLLLNLPVQPNN